MALGNERHLMYDPIYILARLSDYSWNNACAYARVGMGIIAWDGKNGLDIDVDALSGS